MSNALQVKVLNCPLFVALSLGWICRMRSQMTNQAQEERCLRLTSNCQSQPLGALQERIKTLL